MCGSHLCYLLAGGRISHPGESRCKVALLGANHMKPLREYATVESIQRTEVMLTCVSCYVLMTMNCVGC